MIDKIDAKIISKICESYIEQFKLLLSSCDEEFDSIKRAWDAETTDFLTGARRRFKTKKELDTHYYVEMVNLLNDIKGENPTLYAVCTKNMNKVLKNNPTFSKKAGLIVHQDDKYSNTEYYVNYLFSEKALSRCKALIDSFGIK